MSIIFGPGFRPKDPMGILGDDILGKAVADMPGLGLDGNATKPAETTPQTQQVASAPIEGIDPKDWNDLVDTVIAEAGGEGPEGMAAVAHVIRNRATRTGDVGDVIRRRAQFEGYENPGPGSQRAQRDPAMRQTAEDILRQVWSGDLPDPTGGADHFHASYVSPSWANGMQQTTQIGGHLFYRAGTFPGAGRRQAAEATPPIPEPRPDDLGRARGGGGDPEGAGMARLMSPAPAEQPRGAGGNITFNNPGQDRLEPPLMSALTGTSQAIGRDLTILSGYRSPTHEVEARKRQPGQHARGTAADIDMRGMSETERARLVAELQARGVLRFGLYSNSPNMLHVDLKDQTGGGDNWFMYDRTNRNMNKAPQWFRDLADGKGPRAAAVASAEPLILDDNFQFQDRMGLVPRQERRSTPAVEAEATPVDAANEADDWFRQLDEQHPGRFELIPADQYETWLRQWQEAQQPDPLTSTGWASAGLQAIIEGAGGSAAGTIQGIGILLRHAGADTVGSLFDQAGQALSEAAQSVGPEEAYRGIITDILAGMGSMGIYLAAGWGTAGALTARGVGAGGQMLGGTAVAVSLAGPAGSAEAYNRAVEYGLSEEEALERSLPGFGAGAVQVAPVALILRAIPPHLRGNAVAQARHVIEAGVGEFVAEGFGAVLQNLIEQQYNEEKGIWDDTLYQAAIGGSAGALTQLGVTALTRGRGGPVGRPQQGQGDIDGGIGPEGAEVPDGPRGPLTDALEHGETEARRQAERQQVFTVDDPAIGDMEAGPFHGQDVTLADDQSGVPEGMRRVVRPDGSVAVVGDRILRGAEAEPARPAMPAGPAPEGAPAIGAQVRVEAEGVDPFAATIEGYEDGDALVLDMSTGEVLQVPIEALRPGAGAEQAPASTGADDAAAADAPARVTEPVTPERPVPTEITRGMRAQLGDLGWSDEQIDGMSPVEADTILRENQNPDIEPVDPNDPALEPIEPQAREQRTEMPPRAEQMRVTEAFPGPPPAGSRVIVDAPGIDRFPGRIERYEDGEAIVVDDDGTPMQVPIDHLYISRLTRQQAEQQELQRNPPVQRERATGPTTRDIPVAKNQRRQVVMPDDRHARLYDLGAARRQAQALQGASSLDRDRVTPAEQRKLAEEFGVDPQQIGVIADDYRYRVERAARKQREGGTPSKIARIHPEMLKRFRGQTPQEAATDAREAAAPTTEAPNIETAAHEAATSSRNDRPAPSEAQIEAGNYRKGHVAHGGLDLSIENPAGSTRSGKSRSGKPWSVTMKSHYGYIKGTKGKDKDHIDVFLNPRAATPTDADPVYVVDQRDPSRGRFDEHKVMLGYGSEAEARAAYMENYSKGWRGLGEITPTTLGEFKSWLKTGDTTKPFAKRNVQKQPAPAPAEPAPERNVAARPEAVEQATKKPERAQSATPTPKPKQKKAKPAREKLPGAATTPEQVQAKLAEWGADNKLVTRQRASELRRRLKDKLNQASAGIDPEILAIGTELAAFHIEAGARRFGAFARAVADDLDQSLESLRPYLRAWYNGARDMMEDSGLSIDGMDDADAVRAELARLGKSEEASDARVSVLDQDGGPALEGAPSEAVRGTEEGRQAGRGAAGSGQPDLFGGQPARGERVPAGRGVPDGEGAVPAAEAGRRAGADRRPQPDAGSARSDQQRAAQPASVDLTQTPVTPAQERPVGYAITDADQIGAGGAKTKFRNNLAAIALVKQLEAEGRPATRSEQATLAKWVGWGGLSQVFEKPDGSVAKGWEKEAADLKEALTPEEYAAARRSTQDAHYTSPEVVTALWQIAERLGFRGGQVLEPSVGAGNFLGLMPAGHRAGSRITAVELDPITGGIAKHLYPSANVIAPKGFQDVAMPDGHFDLAIGNPPFGRTAIYDGERRHLNRMSIHNYFFAKSLDTLRPGGVLTMVVSNFFMDSTKSRAKDYIASKADLIGAIRLPNTAFMANAGTEVTTDIVVLRKRADENGPGDTKWTEVGTFKDREGREVNLSRYFIDNPDMMLGEFGAFGTMYRGESAALIEREGQDTAALLESAIGKLPENIMPAPGEVRTETIEVPREAGHALVDSRFLDASGKLWRRMPDKIGRPQAIEMEFPSEKARERVQGMVRIRDTFARLRRAQIDEKATDKQIEQLRGDLNKFYDAFVKANGPINQDANKRLFRDDPTWPQVSALENNFDKGISPAVAKKTGETARPPSAEKAPIFRERTQQPYARPTSAKTAKDALAQVLADTGRVDLGAMSRLYGRPESQIIDELGALIYRDPAGQWETADAYLSGNVRQKLAEARRAAENDPAFRRNVVALEEVPPSDIEAVDIDVKAGSPWVPANHVNDFLNHITNGQASTAVYVRALGRWDINAARADDAAQTQWGTDRATVASVVEAALNDRAITITDRGPGDTRIVNQSATEAANEKVERVKQEWRRWLWEDDARRTELARLYNDTFNTDRLRVFDGSHLTLPGKVGDDIIELRPHQKAFVWRAIQSKTVLADHVVGAGKTFAAIAAVMEKRRIGQWRKPIMVVPNHLVGQWAADFVKLYPGARILAATKRDFEADNRKRFFVRMATGDWDAIIVAHSSFGRIGVDPATEEAFIQEQVRHLDESLDALKRSETGKDRSVKQIEGQRDRLKEKLKALHDQAGKDEGMTFDEIGIDGIVVDEAHEFKNLGFATSMTRVAGIGDGKGSKKAADLYMKIHVVKQRTDGSNIMFLTGTPISNTMAEMYTVQRYLDAEGLQALGVEHFDAWAKVFGEVVTDWELSPAGKYKMNSRFSRFVNIPELMQRYLSFADVISNDDIQRQLAEQGKKLPIPKVKGGKPQNVVVQRSRDQAGYIGEPDADGNYPGGSLVHRAENLPKKAEKGADNMLKVMSDARKAALDMRLIDPSYPDNPGSKIHVAADRMVDLYRRWHNQRGTQLVFIDLSTPKAAKGKEAERIRELMRKADAGDESAQEAIDRMSPDEFMALESEFSVYDDLKAKLIDRGIPAAEIAFIHDANTDLQKEELFGKVRSGQVRFLFGSTAKMGAGTNVQNRLVALHHIDAPWRPSDLEQREGRIIRQGNELYAADPDGFEVEINRYATEMTLDSRMWQTIEGKARFIRQVRAGATGDRVIEDIGGEAANAAEMKAAASGNPLILEEMDLRQKLRKLDNQAREHDREQHRIADRLRQLRQEQATIAERMPEWKKDSDAAFKAINDGVVEIKGTKHEKPGEYGTALVSAAARMLASETTIEGVGSFGAFKLRLENTHDRAFDLHVDGAVEHTIRMAQDLREADNVGVGMKLRNHVKHLVDLPLERESRSEQIGPQIERLESQRGDFPGTEELAQVRTRHNQVLEQLKPKQKPQEGEVTAAPADAEATIEPEARRSPEGWGEAEGGQGRRELSEAEQKEIADIVQKVSGLDRIMFAPKIVLPDGAQGWGKKGPVTAGGFYSPSHDIIGIALNSGTTGVAFHEAFHRLQNLFLTPAEKAVLKAEIGRLRRIVRTDEFRRAQVPGMVAKEIEAEAFAIWASKRSTIQPHKTLAAAWERIADMIRRVTNYLSGRGYQTATDIFGAAASGEIAARGSLRQPGSGRIEASIARDVNEALPSAKAIVADLKGKATDWMPAVLGAVPLNYFTELKRPTMTAVGNYMKVKRQMDAYRGRKHAAMDEIAQDWRKYARLGWGPLGRAGKSRAAELADFMHESTLAGIDPTSTDPDVQSDPRFPALRKRFMAMPKAGRDLYVKVRDAYRAQADETDQILLAKIKKAQDIAKEKAKEKFDADIERIRRHSKMSDSAKKMAIEDATKEYAAARTKADWSMKARLTRMRIAFEASRVPPPYFPLARFGSYFVLVKDVDGEVLSFSKRETVADRDRLAADMRKAFPAADVTVGRMDIGASARDTMDPRLVAEIENIVGGAGLDPTTTATMLDQIWQRYLETMPDLSVRKRFIHRKGLPGFEADALRTFASHMFHASHQMGRLKYGMDLQESMNRAVEQAKKSDDPTRGTALTNELRKRHEWVMNPTSAKWSTTINAISFTWMLGATPAAALINMTQTAMLGIPILGARLGGMGKASAALAKASADSIAGVGSVTRANLTADEKKAMEAFYESGLIDRSQAHDLAGVGETGVEYSPIRAQVMKVIAWMYHNTEVWNREVTALAAYRLARDQGQDHAKAVDTAHDLTWMTHFDYSNASRARYLQGDVGKALFVFQSHTLNMTYRILRDTHQALKGDTPAVRREARYQLAGVLGMMSFLAGGTGVFGYTTMMALLQMFFGDDDDPMDFEQHVKKAVLETLGPTAGGIVLKGVPGHLLGIDLTKRIGMPYLWLRPESRELEGRAEFESFVMRALGANVGMIGNWWHGASIALNDGQTARGIEVAAPKFVKDYMKSFRYLNEGLTNLRGDEILAPGSLDAWDAIAQAIGFTPARISETYERNNALRNAERRVMDRRRRLVNEFALAHRLGDRQARSDALDAIRRFNRIPVNRPVAITPDTLQRSLAARERNRRRREDGVLITNERLGRDLRQMLPETVYR